MEVLFEYRGSRRQLTASNGEKLIECITTELRRIGRSRAQVYTANVDLGTVDSNREVYLLQKWSPQWECYLDVNQASDVSDGDKLAVVMKPKPPPKFLLLCCWCSGVQNEPQVEGVPRNKKKAIRKNEEIQALDYIFNVESGRHSRTSEWEETQSLTPSESKETDLNEGEQYVRDESGRASWKLVPLKECDSSEMVSDVENDTIPQEHDTIEQNEEGGEEESSEFEERKAVVSDENAINDKQGVNEEDRPIADHGPDVGDHDTSGKQEERREGQGSKDGVSKDEGGACVKTSDVADEKNEENDKVAAPVDEIHSEKADENQVKDDDSA